MPRVNWQLEEALFKVEARIQGETCEKVEHIANTRKRVLFRVHETAVELAWIDANPSRGFVPSGCFLSTIKSGWFHWLFRGASVIFPSRYHCSICLVTIGCRV